MSPLAATMALGGLTLFCWTSSRLLRADDVNGMPTLFTPTLPLSTHLAVAHWMLHESHILFTLALAACSLLLTHYFSTHPHHHAPKSKKGCA